MEQRDLDRFWSKVEKTADCWLWRGSLNNMGYPVFYLSSNPRSSPNSYAHRVSYELANGFIPNGRLACHKCDNPRCVNPEHLFLGTQKANMADCKEKGRLRPGVLRGEKNGNSKLNETSVREIRAVVNPNISHLAKQYGVARHQIKSVRLRRTWGHVS